MEQGNTYEILGLIGKGGFGRVYRARLRARGGFEKDVAIKILNDELPSEHVLRRFRDESRVLGLIRDRAIVSVDPPTRLAGRWAVIMEYVDGVPLRRILKRYDRIPCGVALEVVREVARALDKVYHQRGADGAELKLLHRDIKPGNIQVTRSGEVKILDFGNARADFAGRESETTSQITGTPGYMAPERYDGIEGHEADVYSLGVTLEALVTMWKPGRTDPPRSVLEELNPPERPVVELARRIACTERTKRMSAREVEDACAKLVRELGGESLRSWAERIIPQADKLVKDELAGEVLTETIHLSKTTGRPLVRAAAGVAGMGAVGVGLGVIVAGALALAVALMFLFVRPTEPPPVPPEVLVPAAVVAPEPPAPVVAPEPEPVEEEAPEPVVEAPVEVAPAHRPRRRPAAVLRPVAFGSVPLGAEVFVDGVAVGDTPVRAIELKDGSHTVKMTLGGAEIERSIEVGPDAPTAHIWRGGDAWHSRR